MLQREFLEKVKSVYKEEDRKCIEYALDFAAAAHEGQFRLSGEAYISHPMEVATVLIGLGMDASTVIAALLHDVIEDTGTSEEVVKRKFGEEIATLVTGVTKLSRLKFNSQEEEQAENIRKLFFAMSNDLRILIIKLADRLHNMRTLDAKQPEKQLKIARETLDIYAPLAGRLGISNIKCELEDLSMKYLFPEEYKFLASKIDEKREERMKFVTRLVAEIDDKLKKEGITADVKGRPKHFYSIFKKMKIQGKTLEQIYDLIAVRVIVDKVTDCYTVLGLIHSMWKPIQGRVKDYIAMPKPNMYQSLHTTVVSNFGQTFEIQIRTAEMNRIAEYGIAAHWKYKENKTAANVNSFDQKLGWIKEVMDVQKDLKDSREFVETLKTDVLSDEIYVFTPKGDVFDLPVGSTCVDFAYRIHSAVGNRCVGAKVNNKIVPLNSVLNSGDVVEIMTQNNAKGPSRDWLKFVKTPSARAKIRTFFKNEMKEENIRLGREMLEHDAKRRGYTLSELMVPSWVNLVLDKYSFTSIDDMYASVGHGGNTTAQILVKLVECYKKSAENNAHQEEELDVSLSQPSRRKKYSSGIIVEGFDDFLIRLSQCCNPVPGDDVVGYISRGRGVSIHRKDCPNMKNVETERLVNVKWVEDQKNSAFIASIRLETEDKNGIIGQISSVVSSMKIPITAMEARSKGNNTAIMNLSLEIKSLQDLDVVIAKLSSVEGVYSVARKQ